MILTAPANTLMEIPYNRPIFFYLCISSTSRDVLENIPSNCLGANRWTADFAAPRAGKRRFPALSKLFTLAGNLTLERCGRAAMAA